MDGNYPNSIRANLAESYVRLGERMQAGNLESITCRAPIVRCDDVVVPIIGVNPQKFSMEQFNIAVDLASESSEIKVSMSLANDSDLSIGVPFRDIEAITPSQEIMDQIRNPIGYIALRGVIQAPVDNMAKFALYGLQPDLKMVQITKNNVGERYDDNEAGEFMQIIKTVLAGKLRAD